MPSEQFEIEITKSGEVKVTFKDVAGAHVVEYIQLLTTMLGPLKEEQVVAKRYEPDPKVGISSKDDHHLHRKIKF
ncbi:MAG: hypothetical protein QME64_04445 [bacterium]|nr:hypothetical protein [bacterium]